MAGQLYHMCSGAVNTDCVIVPADAGVEVYLPVEILSIWHYLPYGDSIE